MTASTFAVGANIFLYVLLGFVHVQAQRNPNAPWAQFLYVRQFGPRTDTQHMTSREQFRSGLIFLVWFAAFFGALVLNATTGPNIAEASNLKLAINFMSAFLALMWLAAALWVFTLGLISLMRPRLEGRDHVDLPAPQKGE